MTWLPQLLNRRCHSGSRSFSTVSLSSFSQSSNPSSFRLDFICPDTKMSNYPTHPLRDKRHSKTDFTSIVQTAYKPSGFINYEEKPQLPYWRDPRKWSLRCWITTVAVNIICLIIIIIVAVMVSKANRYPNYSKLNYRLVETYSGESFFDKFNYFFGYDPAQGFVQYVFGPRLVDSY